MEVHNREGGRKLFVIFVNVVVFQWGNGTRCLWRVKKDSSPGAGKSSWILSQNRSPRKRKIFVRNNSRFWVSRPNARMKLQKFNLSAAATSRSCTFTQPPTGKRSNSCRSPDIRLVSFKGRRFAKGFPGSWHCRWATPASNYSQLFVRCLSLC